MPTTFQARVATYLGSGYIETTGLSENLMAGAKYIIDLLPENKLDEYAADLTDIGTGVTVTGHRVIRAHKGGYRASRIDPGLKTQSTASSNSIYEPSTIDPNYYIENGKGYVLPGGGTIVGMPYPTIAYTDTSILNFPTSLEHGVILFAVIQGCLDLINDNRVALNALAYATLTAPTAPLDSSYSYTDAVLGTYTATLIGSLGTTPNYTAPTATIDGTLWATAYPNYALAITTALSAITTQTGNGVTAQANVAALLASIPTAIGLGNAEVDLAKIEVAKMAADIVLADVETAEGAVNIDLAIDTATAAITTANGRINTAVLLANVEFDKIPAIISEANIEFDKIAAKLATASTTISTNEELSKGRTEIEHGVSIVSNGETYLKEARERYINGNAYLEEAKTSLAEAQGYVSEVQARIAQVQGQLSVSGAYLESAKGYGNVAQSYLGTANGYFAEAQKDIELAQAYSQSTNTYINLAQGYATEVQARLANVPSKVSEFNATVNSAFNSFTKEMEIYKTTAQAAIRQAELDQERLMLNANKTTDLSIQNKAQTLVKDIQLYKDKLEKFIGQLQLYGSQIQDAQIKYSLDQQKLNAQINHFQLLYQGIKKEFEDYLKGRI